MNVHLSKMMKRSLLLLFYVGLVFASVQAEVAPVPVQTQPLLIPQSNEDQGNILEPHEEHRSRDGSHQDNTHDAFHLPLRGPSRM